MHQLKERVDVKNLKEITGLQILRNHTVLKGLSRQPLPQMSFEHRLTTENLAIRLPPHVSLTPEPNWAPHSGRNLEDDQSMPCTLNLSNKQFTVEGERTGQPWEKILVTLALERPEIDCRADDDQILVLHSPHEVASRLADKCRAVGQGGEPLADHHRISVALLELDNLRLPSLGQQSIKNLVPVPHGCPLAPTLSVKQNHSDFAAPFRACQSPSRPTRTCQSSKPRATHASRPHPDTGPPPRHRAPSGRPMR